MFPKKKLSVVWIIKQVLDDIFLIVIVIHVCLLALLYPIYKITETNSARSSFISVEKKKNFFLQKFNQE